MVDEELRATLLYRGGAQEIPARALASHLEKGEIYEAALAARALGDMAQAAELFERVCRFAEAAACWFECGDCDGCIRCAGLVPSDHALYPACARLTVTAAAQLGSLATQVVSFIGPWLTKRPQDVGDEKARRELAGLYARLGRHDDSRKVYAQLAAFSAAGVPQESQRASTGDAARPLGRSSAVSVPARSSVTRRAAADDAPPAVGSVLAERYQLERLLGAGATASVYLAYDLALEQRVAIKLFPGVLNEESKARFRREITLARKLSHDHIVRIFDLVLAPNVQGLTMEHVQGVTLNEYVREIPLSLSAQRDLMVQAALALDYAHQHGIVHRDIKPENLLVATGGELKITDFGIAKACEEATITQTGAFGGTPYYVSPEQINDFRTVDHRADIYSLGVVAYELFLGRPPFEGHSVIELLIQHANTPPPPPHSVDPSFPPGLEALLLKLLEKDPADRFQSCSELARCLSGLQLAD